MNDEDSLPVRGPAPDGMAWIECISEQKPNVELEGGATRALHNGDVVLVSIAEAQRVAKKRPRLVLVYPR